MHHHPASAFQPVQPGGAGSHPSSHRRSGAPLSNARGDVAPSGGSVGQRAEDQVGQQTPEHQSKQQLHQQVLQQLQILGSQQQQSAAPSANQLSLSQQQGLSFAQLSEQEAKPATGGKASALVMGNWR